MIRVVLNGEERELESGLSVSDLLCRLGLHPRMVVVEHNRQILDRRVFEDTEVRAGDSFELVHFVGGG
jgi:sulfur carrier protein